MARDESTVNIKFTGPSYTWTPRHTEATRRLRGEYSDDERRARSWNREAQFGLRTGMATDVFQRVMERQGVFLGRRGGESNLRPAVRTYGVPMGMQEPPQRRYARREGGGGGSYRQDYRGARAGQIFTGGPAARLFGLRAAGLATMGFAGAAFLALDQGLERLLRTVGSLNQAYEKQVENLRPFSASLQLAAAERNIQLMTTRMRLAGEYSAEFAGTFRARTRRDVSREEFQAEFARSTGGIERRLANIETMFNEAGKELLGELQGPGNAIMEIGYAFQPLGALWQAIKTLDTVARRWLEINDDDAPAFGLTEAAERFFADPAATFRGIDTPFLSGDD